MAVWRETIQDEEYKKLPLSEKRKTKSEFFKYNITQSDKWKSLSPQNKLTIQKHFFIDKPEEELTVKPSFKNIIELTKEEFRKSPIGELDKQVEKLAGLIEPKKAEEGLEGALKFIPRQMLAEVTRAYKPSTVGLFAGVSKLAKPIAKPVSKFIAKKTPKVIKKGLLPVKKFLEKNLTVGKGQPKAYQILADEAKLEKLAGGREAQKVADILTKKPTGKLLSREEQKYVGRIFRKEISETGKKSFLTLTPKQSARIAKNIEVETAFSPKVQSIQNKLELVNKSLRNKELLAKGMVGKEFRTGTGFIEKVSGIEKIEKLTKKGKPFKKPRFKIGLEAEPVSPIPPTTTPIPAELLKEGEGVARGIRQVSKLPTTNKFVNLTRKELLNQRKNLSRQLQEEIKTIHLNVRSNYEIFDKTFVDKIVAHPKYQELKSISDSGRAIMDKWSTELANSGIPKKQAKKVIEENIGSYMARMYPSKLKPQKTGFNLFKDMRLRLNGLKHRKELSEEALRAMNVIKEPALPAAIEVKEISSSMANNKLFSKVAQNPEWVANSNISGNLIKMPDSASVGALKGKWVIPEIADDINAITKIGEQSRGLYLKALSAWKYGKVVLNPAAQTRNLISNTMLLDLSGTNHLRQAQLFPRVFKEYMSKGKMYQQALKDGAIGSEFVGTETMQKLKSIYINSQENNLQKFMKIASTPFKKPGELYQGMEQVSKMVKYMDVLEKTGNSKLASQEAQKWLFDYNKVPKIIDWVRKLPIGAPFITFTYKAIPRIGEAIVNRPLAVYKYKALFDSINETSRKYQGMSPVEYSRQKKLLPKWILKDIGGMPTNLLLPWKDKYNRTQWLNLEYILPVGQAPEMAERGLAGFVSSPAFNIVSDIIKNTDFKGKEIIPPEATKVEASKAIAEYIYRQLAPSLAPGGYSYEKIRAGIMQEPEKFAPERTREAIPAILDSILGIKINPLDVDEAEQFKTWDKKKRIDALNKEFYRIINNPLLKEDFRDKKIEDIFKKKEKVIDE